MWHCLGLQPSSPGDVRRVWLVETIRRGLLVPCLCVALAVLVLLGLGTWQVYRLHWKEGILARIAAAEHAPVLPLGANPPQYERVSVTGHFRFDLAARYGIDVRDTLKGPIPGHYQVVPMERDGAPTLLVNRGWVPETAGVSVDKPGGVVTVIGFVRPGSRPSWFSPADNPADRQFYTLDPPVILKSLGIDRALPFALTVLGPDENGRYPVPAQDFPRPPNNHLSYAITWYSLAVVLVVIFVLRLRERPGKRTEDELSRMGPGPHPV